MGNEHRDRAVRLLVNYFSAIAAKAGFRWDPDYSVEVGEAVDEMILAAQEPQLSEHAKQVQQLIDQRLSHLEDLVDRGLSTATDSTEEHGLL